MPSLTLSPGTTSLGGTSIPDGWKALQLRDFCDFAQGGRLGLTKQDNYVSFGVPAYSAAGQDGYVARTEYRDTRAVVLSAIGANCGRCFYAAGNWTTLANVQTIVPLQEVGDARFLFYRVNRDDYWPRSGSAQPFIKPSDIKTCWVTLPPLPEQHGIAQVLDTLDTTIRQTEAIIEKLKQVKQGLLHDLLTRGIDPNGELRPPQSQAPHLYKDSPLGWIPREWDIRAGSDCFELFGGSIPRVLREDGLGAFMYLKVDDFNNPENANGLVQAAATFNHSSSDRVSIYGAGQLVFPKRGAAILHNRVQLLCKQGTVDPNLMVLRPKDGISPAYFREVLLHFGLHNICDNSGVPQINNKHLYPLEFALPGADEQLRAITLLESAQNRINLERESLAKLGWMKSGLMDDLLTGRVRVTPLLQPEAAP